MGFIRIAIVDDHHIFSDGLNILLSGQSNMEVVLQARNGKEFIDKYKNYAIDVVLMDIDMPVMGGIETTKIICTENTEIKIIALSMHGDEKYYYEMINSGARGFLLKESKSSELLEAIQKVYEGDNYFSQELLRKIIHNFGNEKSKSSKKGIVLSERETEVLANICNGLSNTEISETMHISQRTVEGHRASLLKKAKAHNTASLIMFAIRNKLIKV